MSRLQKWALIVVSAIGLTALVHYQANAMSSVRYRPVTVVQTNNYYYHEHNHNAEKTIAITAIAVGVVMILIAASDERPHSTGDAGYDRYLAERPRWQDRNYR